MAAVESVIKDVEIAQEEKPPEDSSIQRDGTPAPADVLLESKSSESVIDYAKNTMNSFLSMYGYEESMTTEVLKSKIKCEPISPSKEKKHSYSAEVISAHIANIKTEEVKKDVNTASARTATVMPIQSTSKTERLGKVESINPSNIGGTHNGQGNKGAVGVPRKPITPYMRYRNMIFEEIKHKYPGCSPYDLACLISSKWSMLTDSERKVWEDQYEQEMRDYSVNLKEYSETLKKIFKSTDPASPAAVIKGVQSEENKAPVRQGTCNWCKKATVLLDFSSVLEGKEIYCTGLCSEKCFTEAAKQILSIENGNNKPRYVSGNHASQSREDASSTTSFAAIPQYSTVTNTESSQASFQVFDWDPYLIETQSSAAPWLYFKQSRYPPPNNFVVGMKLEACNGQSISGYSLATVVAVCGARILLHFDGSDMSSDIWRLPDSGDIHPVGWTEASQLKPPSGYKYDFSKYRRFHASSLQNAEIAPARLFKKEPTTPIENYFITGMKLEAVNKQNPSAIGVATVTDVDEERIRIEFDTYKGLGYWCHYSDRDLFPAGWCSRSGHPLKSPGSSDSKSPLMTASQGSSSPSMVSTTSESRSNTGSPYVIYPSPAPTPTARETTWKDKNATGNNNVEIFINTECYCGPYLDSRKVQQMQHVYRGSIVTVLKSVLEDTVRCAIDSKTVFGFLKPGRGNCVITATCDGMTYQCCLNSIDRVSTFWRVLEQFSDNLRCCSNLFSSVDYRQCCNRCSRSKSTNIGSEQQIQLGKRSATPSGYSLNKTRRTDSTSGNNELHKQSSRQEHTYEPSSYVSVYDTSREESDVVQPRKDSLHRDNMLQESRQENLHQDSLHQDSLHQESLRQDILRQDTLRQDTLRQDSMRQDTLRQDSMRQDTLRQDSKRQDSIRQDVIRQDSLLRQESIRDDSSLRQESIRQDSSLRQESIRQDSLLRQESMRQDSLYETMRQENFSNQLPKEDNTHYPVSMETNYDIDREMASGDAAKQLEKRKKEEQNEDLFEVNGVEISSAPKSWSIDQVISFIQQTDLRDNVDKFKDNEIDGKALLLLQRDLVLSHMGFKLGPAVKLLDLIEELKIVQGKFR